jgi:hypothetical protein
VSELEQELVSGGDHPTMLKQVYQVQGILHERLTGKHSRHWLGNKIKHLSVSHPELYFEYEYGSGVKITI